LRKKKMELKSLAESLGITVQGIGSAGSVEVDMGQLEVRQLEEVLHDIGVERAKLRLGMGMKAGRAEISLVSEAGSESE
jgi:hypothetical protein